MWIKFIQEYGYLNCLIIRRPHYPNDIVDSAAETRHIVTKFIKKFGTEAILNAFDNMGEFNKEVYTDIRLFQDYFERHNDVEEIEVPIGKNYPTKKYNFLQKIFTHRDLRFTRQFEKEYIYIRKENY